METEELLPQSRLRSGAARAIDRSSTRPEQSRVGSVANILAILRLILALSILALINHGFSGEAQSFGIATIFLAYLIYSTALCLGTVVRLSVVSLAAPSFVWADLAWLSLFALITRGGHPILLGAFCLATVAAFHYLGRQVGLVVSLLASMILAVDMILDFGFISFSSFNGEVALTVAFSCFLLLLGFFALFRDREESTLKRRLVLLAEISDLSNPRFGVESMVSTVLEKLKAFYAADQCLLVSFDEIESGYCLRRAATNGQATGSTRETITEPCAQQLLAFPETHAFVLNRPKLPFLGKQYFEVDLISKKTSTNIVGELDALSAILESESILSVPVIQHEKVTGRLFLTSNTSSSFSAHDPEFLSQLIRQVVPMIENMRLVDKLATSAGERERRRIALDIHDSFIQPYIGIQLGLGGIRQKIQAGITDVIDDLERLSEIAELEVSGLRRYITELSNEVSHQGHLLSAVQRLTEKFAATTGIAVVVKCNQDLQLNDRLAAEAFQMVAEGLSNIRRHTKASEAHVDIKCERHTFQLRIINGGWSGSEAATSDFVPKSITSRVTSLGGNVLIKRTEDGETTLIINIPL